MESSFLWGLFGASGLLLGAALAIKLNIPKRILGLIMAFGVGVLISAVAYELVEEAFNSYISLSQGWTVALGLAAGALVFFTGDILVDKMGGRRRKEQEASYAEGSGVAILLGTVLDGIPESIVIGLSLVGGGKVSAAMVVAVFLSNLPEAISSTWGLKASGWKHSKIVGLWCLVVLMSGVASLLGFLLFDSARPGTVAFTLAFAAGALLTMLADTMMPDAYRDSGKLAGLLTTLGFGLAFYISLIE